MELIASSWWAIPSQKSRPGTSMTKAEAFDKAWRLGFKEDFSSIGKGKRVFPPRRTMSPKRSSVYLMTGPNYWILDNLHCWSLCFISSPRNSYASAGCSVTSVSNLSPVRD